MTKYVIQLNQKLKMEADNVSYKNLFNVGLSTE